MYRWLHPLKLFIIGALMMIMTLLFEEGLVTVVSAIQTFNLGYVNPNITSYDKDWAYLIAATVWICGFSIGVFGAVVNLANALRVRVNTTKQFDELKELTKAEAQTLREWLNMRTYNLGYLKEMWGVDYDD